MKLICELCGADEGQELVAEVNSRPERETDFLIPESVYHRNIYRCSACRVYWNHHNMITKDLYAGSYNEVVYQNNISDKYDKIMGLNPSSSDNFHRVDRINNYMKSRGIDPSAASVLDVGSGLCVFAGRLKLFGYSCYCLDPDPLSVKHAVEHVRVTGAFCSHIESFQPDMSFDLICMNKVLEHMKNPIEKLSKVRDWLLPGAVCYVELPDGDAAKLNGDVVSREEFFIEHFTIFNSESMTYLADKSGFQIHEIKCIHEPSDKYTIYAFMSAKI